MAKSGFEWINQLLDGSGVRVVRVYDNKIFYEIPNELAEEWQQKYSSKKEAFIDYVLNKAREKLSN